MRCFFRFITCFIITGAKGEMVEVKRGDSVKLNLYTPLENISRLTVKKDGADVLRHCSSEEKGRGCEEVNSARFSLESGEIGVSLTCPDADSCDAGAYEVEVIDQNNTPTSRIFNITIIEQLAGNFHPTPPFIHSSPTPDVPKNKTSSAVNQRIIIGVTVSTVVLMLVIIGVCFNYQRRKKKKQKLGKENGELEIHFC